MRLYRVAFIALLASLCGAVGFAAEPPKDPNAFVCLDAQKRAVTTTFMPSLKYFAEARPLDETDRRSAASTGPSPFAIRINRSIYYLGLTTQSWLYQRQCARIQDPRLYLIVEVRDLPLSDAQERALDCAAIKALVGQTNSSLRMLVTSIESDMERLQPERWSNVLPGPQRRLNLATCALAN